MIQANGDVYAFGGINSNKRLAKSERFSLERNSWNQLSPMCIPKHAFSPCLYASEIYLIELREFKGAEKFNIRSESYITLSMALPTSITSSAYNVLVGKEILFLNRDKQVLKWNIETNAILNMAFSGVSIPGQLASNTPALCLKNYACFVQQDTGKVGTFNLVSLALAYL